MVDNNEAVLSNKQWPGVCGWINDPKHYTFILNRENRAELWPVYLAYDAEICKRTTHFPIDPSVFSLSIWNDLEARHTA